MRQVRIVAACFLILLGAAPQREVLPPATATSITRTSDELTERRMLIEEVRQHIASRDFAWLDSTERKLRSERSRTVSGVWKLDVYYNAMWHFGSLEPAPGCTDTADSALADWRRASPKSPAPFIASAQRLLDKGWCLRGSGYAREVDEAAWEPFYEHLDAAYDMLEKNKAVASADPQYYAVMASIYVAQGRSDDEFQELLNEATAREPYYYGLYFEAFRYYEPQWGGSYEAEESLAHFAVQQTRQKDRSSAFARIYWVAMECGCLPPVEALNEPMLRQSMSDLAELYPEPWNLSHLARMACAIGDGNLARTYFSALPAGDEGKSGWADGDGFDVPHWQECRTAAGLSSTV